MFKDFFVSLLPSMGALDTENLPERTKVDAEKVVSELREIENTSSACEIQKEISSGERHELLLSPEEISIRDYGALPLTAPYEGVSLLAGVHTLHSQLVLTGAGIMVRERSQLVYGFNRTDQDTYLRAVEARDVTILNIDAEMVRTEIKLAESA